MAKARNVESIPEVTKTGYPEPFASRVAQRARRKLGDAFGLTQFGVNLTTLAPGTHSAMRHWHTHEDELTYILEGELVLVTDAGEQIVRAGDVVGFPGGSADAHHMINRSSAPARFLEVGSRLDHDLAHYPDDDMEWRIEGDDQVAYRKDGTRY